MEVNHRFIPTTFKLNPWRGVKGTTSSIFDPNLNKVDMARLLQYVYEQIADTKYGILKKNLFSLVNVYNPDTKHSVGYLSAPPKEVVRPNSGLILTFSLVSRPYKNPPTDPYVNRIVDFTHFWGKDILSLTDYLTINLSKDFLKKLKTNHHYKNDLLYIYNVVGIASKNWVLHQTPLNSDYLSTVDEGLLQSRYFEKQLPDTFKNFGQDSWQFVSAIWEECSNLLGEKHFAGTFPYYFSLFLFDKYGKSLGVDAKHFIYGSGEGTLSYYIASGLRRLNQMLRSTSTSGTIEKDMYSVVHLILTMLDGEGLDTDQDKEVWKFIVSLRNYIDSENSKSAELFNLLSMADRLSRNLIDQNPDDPLIGFLEEIL